MASTPQANLKEGGNTTQGNFAAALYDLEKFNAYRLCILEHMQS